MRILLFGRYAQRAGKSEIRCAVSRPTTLRALLSRIPKLAGLAKRPGALKVAVNREFVGLGVKVGNRDEVALLPPFSGG